MITIKEQKLGGGFRVFIQAPTRSGAAGSENTALEVISICYDSYGAIPVGPVDTGPQEFKPPECLWMGKAKDIIEATTDDGHLWSDLFEKGKGTGMRTAMVRYKDHIALKIESRVK